MLFSKELTDTKLVQRLADDDATAFTIIYTRYAKKLTDFASAKLFSLDDARDIIHDIFVKLWEDRKQLNVTSNLNTYLFAITRYRIIDKIRKNITREEYFAMLQLLADSYQPSIEQQIAAIELEQIIDKSISQLTPRVKEIYYLSRKENLSITEIAKKLGLSEQTVKNQLSSALSHLKKSLTSISLVTLLWWLY